MTVPTTSASHAGSVSVPDPGLLEKYGELFLRHPALDRALAEVERGIAPEMPPQIVLLPGPTGVGKTTMVDALVRPSCYLSAPAVKVTCPPVLGRRGYDFGRMHWRLIAKALRDRFPDDHVSPDEAARRLRAGSGRRDGVPTLDEYRLGVLEMVRACGPRAVVLDEAQHMTRVPSARTQGDQFDVIKDCVDRTGVTHVLVGTHEMSVMEAASEQVGRRALVVHFAPYASPNDEHFQRIFGEFVAGLPFAEPKRSWLELSSHIPDVFLGCVGCVGILKEWLGRALRRVLESGGDRLNWPIMDETCLSAEALTAIAEAIRAYRESERPDRTEIARILGVGSGLPERPSQSRSSSRRKPGKRSPARDPVGVPSEPKVSA